MNESTVEFTVVVAFRSGVVTVRVLGDAEPTKEQWAGILQKAAELVRQGAAQDKEGRT